MSNKGVNNRNIHMVGKITTIPTIPWLRPVMSPPSPVPPWVQWSNELAREMYIKCVLQRLELQYPHDPNDS